MEEYHQKSSFLDIAAPVIAVLVIAAVLYPIFLPKRCVTPARQSSCQNNLKEIGIALQLYWNDYDDCLPSSALVRHSKNWSTKNFLAFAIKQGELPLPQGRSPQTWPEVLHDHMSNTDFMWCPAEQHKNRDHNTRVSYWYKLAIDKAWYGDGCSRPCRNQKDFTYQSDQIVFYEHRGWHFSGGKGLENGVQINVVYLDSHVKTVQIQNATSGSSINCAANSNGSPMYFNCDTKTNTILPANAPAKYVDPGRYVDKFN